MSNTRTGVNKARNRAVSLGSVKRASEEVESDLKTPRINTTALALKGFSSSESQISTISSTESSPRDPSLLHEPKVKSSPRRNILISSNKGVSPRSASSSKNISPRSTHSSPRSKSSSSPRIAMMANLLAEDEGILPISNQDVAMMVFVAKERFANFTNAEKVKTLENISEEEAQKIAKSIKECGYSFSHPVRIENSVTKKYPVLITGNFGSGSMIYLLDRSAKLGEGANGELYFGYDLQREEKCAIKIFKETAEDCVAIFREMNHLSLLGRFKGYCVGEIELAEELKEREDKSKNHSVARRHAIIMRLEPGKSLIEYLYYTDAELKANEKYYKDRADYYQSKKKLSYKNRLTLAISIILALEEIHHASLIHRDISCDNLLVEEKEGGYRSCFIDLDAATNLGCDLLTVNIIPKKNRLYNLPFLSNAAYVRYNEQLFYVSKEGPKCEKLEISDISLRKFDEMLNPTDKARTLTLEELINISNIMRHRHEAPIHSELNVAYGFAPPELCKTLLPGETKPYATFASDIYALGVVLVDIFSDRNLQKSLREKFQVGEEKTLEQSTGVRKELSPDELKKMVDDIFYISSDAPAFDRKHEKLKNYVYRLLILSKIRGLLDILLAEEPGARLKNGGLKELANEFIILQDNYISAYNSLQQLTVGISSLQEISVPLTEVAKIILQFPAEDAREYFAKSIDQLLSVKSASSQALKNPSAETFLFLLNKEEKCQERRQQLIKALKAVIENWDKFKSFGLSLSSLQPLIQGACADGVEAWDFVQQLPLEAVARDKEPSLKR